MWDFKIKEVLATLWKTKEFVIFRFLVYMAITVAYIVATGAGGGIGYLLGKTANNDGAGIFYGMIGGFSLVGGVTYYFREYLLYLVNAGHIAVLVKRYDGETMPEDKSQVKYAQEVVKQRFAESSVLFGVDQIIKGVLKTFSRIFSGIMSFIPFVPQGLVKFINGVVSMSLTYVDEVILAYYIRNNSENPWEDARKALILYAQNYKTFLKNALFLTVFSWVLSLLVIIVVFAPLAGLMSLTGYTGGFWVFVLAIVVAWGIKAALIDPFAMTALMHVFFKVTEGQEPNPEWEAKLEQKSKKFVELKNKAVNWTKSKFSGTTADDKQNLSQ